MHLEGRCLKKWSFFGNLVHGTVFLSEGMLRIYCRIEKKPPDECIVRRFVVSMDFLSEANGNEKEVMCDFKYFFCCISGGILRCRQIGRAHV